MIPAHARSHHRNNDHTSCHRCRGAETQNLNEETQHVNSIVCLFRCVVIASMLRRVASRRVAMRRDASRRIAYCVLRIAHCVLRVALALASLTYRGLSPPAGASQR